jgi:hypothetical protein
MALKGASLGVAAPGGTPSTEKRKTKKDKVQNAWLATVSKTREHVPLPSLHLRISLTDISRPRLGKWSTPRRQGNENIEVVRTKSQAGMLRPRRLPTIYKSNSRLVIDPLETPSGESAKPDPNAAESEKDSVIVDISDRVQMHISASSPEKHSVIVEIPDGFEVKLSAGKKEPEQSPSRFVELNDDASVHELEAVYPTTNTSVDEVQLGDTIAFCEADDPTVSPSTEHMQPSLSVNIKQRRPKISLSIPRSKSFHVVPESGTPGSSFVLSPPSPPSSTTLYRSLTQPAVMRFSLISPLTPIDMPRPIRPYSTISVPLYMEASELVRATEEVPPVPTFTIKVDEYGSVCSFVEQIQAAQQSPAEVWVEDLEENSQDSEDGEAAVEEDNLAIVGDSPVEIDRSLTKKTMAESINKPLPPEPQMPLPATLPPLVYKPRQIRNTQSKESLRSRYSPIHTGKFDDFKRLSGGRSLSIDEATEELEWRLSSICEHLQPPENHWPQHSVHVSKDFLIQRSSSPPPFSQSEGSSPVRSPRRPIVRSNSANHIILQSRGLGDKKTRSCQDLQWPVRTPETSELSTVEESETWYRTASERSSADLSPSVFSEAGTDGTCQTEQSNTQEKVKEKVEAEIEKERVIDNIELPQAMQSSSIPADVAENIILRIMSNLTTLKDLFATAALNKGFYNTFKRHEMYLIKATLFKSSVAAWELRESSEENHITPTAYLRQYSVEIYTMGMLKSLILVQCESFLRPATIAGLVGTDQARSIEIDAAFWRVWTFCRLFGRDAGENEEIESQIDWLNGGHFARESDPSTSYGVGNGDGLSKSELYDMNELWTCLSVLVQTFHGRVAEARTAGIFDDCKVDEGRDEEAMLEEWTWYLLTLGPSCILALAPGSFSTAKNLGWTQWTPPASGPPTSRSKFLKGALTRVYEVRLVEEAKAKSSKVKEPPRASHRMTKSEIAREVDRARQTAFAKELRSQRHHSPSKSEPWTFSDERPMSKYSQIVRSLPIVGPGISPKDFESRTASRRSKDSNSRPSSRKSSHTTPERPDTPVLTSSSALPTADDDFPVSPTGHVFDDSFTPITETMNHNSGIVDPADRAMTHLVDVLGFPSEHAKWALTRSETGHGVDVERALEILLNGSPPGSRASSRAAEHSPIEVESSSAQPVYRRNRTPVRILHQRDSIVTTDEMTDKEKERANIMRMREKSYRVLGIGAPGKKFGSNLSKRLSRR